MTVATDLEFVIGEHYRVIEAESFYFYKKAAIYEFIIDDGSACPMFKYISGPKKEGCEEVFIPLHALEPVPKQLIPEEITINGKKYKLIPIES